MKRNIFIAIIIIIVAVLISALGIIFINNNNEEQNKKGDTKEIESSNIENNDMINKLTDKYSLIKEEKIIAEGTKKNYIVYDSTKGLWESKARENALYNKYKEMIKARKLETYTSEECKPQTATIYNEKDIHEMYIPCYTGYVMTKGSGELCLYYGDLKTDINQKIPGDTRYDFSVAKQILTSYDLESFNKELGTWKHEDGLKKALELHKKTFENLTNDNVIEGKINMGDVKQYDFYQGAKFEGYYVLKDKNSGKTNKVNIVGVIIEGSGAPNIIAFYDGRQEGENLINYYKNELDNILELYWEPDVWLGKIEVYWK